MAIVTEKHHGNHTSRSNSSREGGSSDTDSLERTTIKDEKHDYATTNEKNHQIEQHDPATKLDAKVIKVKDDANEDPFAHLPDHEAAILRRQVEVLKVKVGVKTLYRYSTRNDLLIIVVSIICAIAGGAAQPLMTVSFDMDFCIFHFWTMASAD